MTPQHIDTVRRSFAGIAGRHDEVGAVFRRQLLGIEPALAPMFDDDPQARMAMQLLGAVVGLLHRPELLHPSLVRLAGRIGPGVRAVHACSVGRAFMATMREVLGRRWTRDVEEAWTAVYAMAYTTVLASLVQAAVVEEERLAA